MTDARQDQRADARLSFRDRAVLQLQCAAALAKVYQCPLLEAVERIAPAFAHRFPQETA